MDRDSRGYALSLDILLALIPLTLILGLAAADMDNLMYEVQDAVYRGGTERVAADTMNTLLTTSGDPYNWENNVNSTVVPGLARYDLSSNQSEKYYLLPRKVINIQNAQIQNLLGDQYGFAFNISSLNGNVNVLRRGSFNNGLVDPSAEDVVRVERIVLYGQYEIVSEALNIRGTGKPLTIAGNVFQTNVQYNQLFDYYVYVNSTGITSVTAAWVDINDNNVVKSNDFGGGGNPVNPVVKLIDPTYLQNETELMDNTVTVVLAGSPTDKMNVYILQVPKGTPASEIRLNGANTARYRATLYVWLR